MYFPKEDFIGIDGVHHLAAGGETPFLKHHLAAVAQFATDKAGGMPGRERFFASRERVCTMLAQLLNVEAADIALVGSSSAGMIQVVSAYDWRSGDEVVTVDDEYPSGRYLFTWLARYGVTAVMPAYDPHPDNEVDAIVAAITPRTKAILIGYPNNPTGAVIDATTMQAIVDLALQHDLTLISDEIYDRLVYGVPHVSAVTATGARDCTVLMGGFSKAYAMTGWRLGWLAAPADICGAVRKIHQYGIMSAPTAAQYAGLEALRHGAAATQMMVAEYDRRRQVLLAGLRRIGLPTFEARGAFYLFPQIAHLGVSSADFCEQLLNQEHVAVIPGDVFGPSGAGFVRLCYAASMTNIEVALERIERFIRRVE
ncbi:MAG: aminotransferase class I/II-fold pyridoxal phosphate-dependent enzyme [Chloroflexia bacterium]|nr:aminotransferase class I/II-fold pyridoxal phosphate-dependent enzyme [Chloroflexia bacterium]